MRTGVIAKKIGMSRIFNDDGRRYRYGSVVG